MLTNDTTHSNYNSYLQFRNDSRVANLVQLKDQVTKQPNKITENQKVVHPFNTTVIYLCLGSCTMVPCRFAQTLPPTGVN